MKTEQLPEPEEALVFIPFPKIKDWRHARVHAINHELTGKITYRGTIKLHGTNAAVTYCTDTGEIGAQSRNRRLTAENDNFGFYVFVDERREELKDLCRRVIREFALPTSGIVVVLYGEWCGKGIQRTCAVSEAERFWAIFDAAYVETADAATVRFIDVDFTRADLPNQVYDICDSMAPLSVDVCWGDDDSVAAAMEFASKWTAIVDADCPMGEFLGLRGAGEGLVWRPRVDSVNINSDPGLWYKTKGRSHLLPHQLAQAGDNDTVADGIKGFIAEYISVERFEQAFDRLRELDLPVDRTSTGDFLRLAGSDAKLESAATRKAAGISWRTVSGIFTDAAKRFYAMKCDEAASASPIPRPVMSSHASASTWLARDSAGR